MPGDALRLRYFPCLHVAGQNLTGHSQAGCTVMLANDSYRPDEVAILVIRILKV